MYGVCSTIRLKNEHNQVHVSFLMGKSRVILLKHMTVPRLELTAALVAVQVSKFLNKELILEGVKNFYWSDSQVALGYIANDTRRFHSFVANRVDQIRDYTNVDKWFYIRSEDNPADCASRGLTASQFIGNSYWLSGPILLWDPCFQPTRADESASTIAPNDPEVKKVFSFMASSHEQNSVFQRVSNWSKLTRIIALCFKFIRELKNRIRNPKQGHGLKLGHATRLV